MFGVERQRHIKRAPASNAAVQEVQEMSGNAHVVSPSRSVGRETRSGTQ